MKKNLSKIISNYYILLSTFMLLYTIYKYNQYHSFNIYILIYLLITIGLLIINFFHSRIFKLKISNILPKNKLMMSIFIIIILTSLSCYSTNNDIIFYKQDNSSSNVGAILVDPVIQKINTKNVTIDSIYIKFATYNRTNDATYRINLLENDIVIYEEIFNSEILRDGEFFRFYIGKNHLAEDSKYEIVITPIYATSDNCVSIFENEDEREINYMLANIGDIDFFKINFIIIMILIFLLFNYIINTRNLSAEKFYLMTGIYMLILLFIIPPWNVPDEPVHFFRSYKLSQISIDDMSNDLMKTNIFGPNIGCINYSNIEIENKVNDKSLITECLKNQRNENNDYDYLVSGLNLSNPINHIVPSLGIKVIDLLTNSPLLIFFSGRISNFLISLLIVYFAIKNTSKNKIILLLVATIPMFIQQMVSYSYDSLLNSFSILLLSYSIKILEKDNLNKKDYLLICLSTIFMFSAKMIYILLLVPLFFKKSDNKKEVSKNILIMLGIIIISYIIVKIWPYILNNITESNSSTSSIETKNNLQYLLSNPAQIFSIIYNTFAKNTMFYLRGLFGYFGWFCYKIDDIYIWIYLLIFYLVLKSDKLSENVFNNREKIISIIICLIMFGGTFAAMYFYWSEYMLNYIDGVQGRYFIPFTGLLLVSLISNKKKNIKIEQNDIYIFINMIFLMVNILLICSYY